MKQPTITMCLEKLSLEDKKILCLLVNAYTDLNNIHPGSLAFVSVTVAQKAVQRTRDNTNNNFSSRTLLRLAAVLNDANPDTAVISAGHWHTRTLNPAKVRKHFGTKPELGTVLKHLGCDKDREGNLIYPCVVVKPLGANCYQISCADRWWPRVELWLLDECS